MNNEQERDSYAVYYLYAMFIILEIYALFVLDSIFTWYLSLICGLFIGVLEYIDFINNRMPPKE